MKTKTITVREGELRVEQKLLESGWTRLRILDTNRYGGWAQIPPGFNADTIPDDYIFDPEWNRDRVNAAYKNWRTSNEN